MIIILTRSTSFPSNILFKNICNAKKIPLRFFNPFEEVLNIEALKGDEIIVPRSSGVLFDDIDLHLAEELEYKGHKVVNKSLPLRILRDKDRQLLKLEREQLNPLPFAILRGKVEEAEEYLHQKIGELSNGFLVKSIRSNQGKGQFRMDTLNDLSQLWNNFLIKQDQRYIVTPFMKEFKEYRVFFMGNDYFCVEKAPSIFGHQRNADNSDFSPASIPSELLESARKVKANFDLDYGAIDYVNWNDRYYILEVNGLPGFSHIEKVLEENLAEKFILSLLD